VEISKLRRASATSALADTGGKEIASYRLLSCAGRRVLQLLNVQVQPKTLALILMPPLDRSWAVPGPHG